MNDLTSQRFIFEETPIEGLFLVNRRSIVDTRGFFNRFWCEQEFKAVKWEKPIVQINHTLTRLCGSVRGLHFQHPPYDEMKLVTCTQGKIFDVAVDLRFGSPTFLHLYTTVLDAEKMQSLLIPEGFAHGFQTMTDDCELMYLHTNYFSKESEGALNVMDTRLNINWPLEITEISERDKAHAMITTEFTGITL